MQEKLVHLMTANYEQLTPQLQREIYDEYYQLMYPIIIYMVKDHATTEDIIQSSFIKVIRNVPETTSEVQLKAWMKVVVKNTVFNYFRKTKKNRNDIDSDSVYINENSELTTEPGSIEQEVELKFMSETLEQCLRELKPEYRSLIELRWKRDLSYKEIAAELDTTQETVKYKLYRAREAMKKRFKKKWGGKNE